MTKSNISNLISKRQSVYPPLYIKKEIPKDIIDKMLANAHRAPTHKLTEPWRFKVLKGDSRKRLGEFLSAKYKELYGDKNYSERKFKRFQENPLLADTVIVIVMQRDLETRIPEWEEVAAVAMAVQNIWLTATAHDIGGYWSSPKLIDHMGDFFNLNEGEKCLGFFYMGYYEAETPLSKRNGTIEDKVEWIYQ